MIQKIDSEVYSNSCTNSHQTSRSSKLSNSSKDKDLDLSRTEHDVPTK